MRGSARQHAPCPSTRVPIIGDPVGEVVLRSISWFSVRIRSQRFFPRSALPFLVMTDGAFVTWCSFWQTLLTGWSVSYLRLLIYLPPLHRTRDGLLCFAGAIFVLTEFLLRIKFQTFWLLPSDLRPYINALLIFILALVSQILFYNFILYKNVKKMQSMR